MPAGQGEQMYVAHVIDKHDMYMKDIFLNVENVLMVWLLICDVERLKLSADWLIAIA